MNSFSILYIPPHAAPNILSAKSGFMIKTLPSLPVLNVGKNLKCSKDLTKYYQ